MAKNWWEDDPIASPQSSGGANWWDADPIVSRPAAPAKASSPTTMGDYAAALNTGLATGIANTGAAVGTFLQDPGGAVVSGLTGARAAADRGMTWLINQAGGNAVAHTPTQEAAQMAADVASVRRSENAANPWNMPAVMGKYMEDDSRRVAAEIQASERLNQPELVRQQDAMSKAEGFVGNLKAAWDNPLALTHTLARSAPDMAFGVGVGSTLHRAGAGVGAVSRAGVATEAASSAMQAREGTYQQVVGMPVEQLAASPRFREILQEVSDPIRAREVLANELADQTPVLSGLGTAAGTLLTNRLFGGDATAKSIVGSEKMGVREFGRRVAQDTVEEGVQGVPEDTVQHGAVVQADPSKKWDPAGSLAQNMVAGFAMGAGGHGLAAARENLPSLVARQGQGNQAVSPEQQQSIAATEAATNTADPKPAPSSAAPAPAPTGEQVGTASTDAAEKALREPVTLTALDRVSEIDTEAARLNDRLAELNDPAGGYGPVFDAERQELVAQSTALAQERDRIASTWPKAEMGAPTSFSTEAGVKLGAQYALVEADDLITSHDENLRSNPLYPQELQPRDRSRSASELQVSGIVQKLDPARLGVSADAATGAPIVGADGLVESGNGRMIALKRVYEAKGKTADDYKQFLRDSAGQFGLDAAKVDGMAKPVLVRVRTTPVNRAEFARQANASTVQRMGASEQALSDAKRITTLEGLAPDENGDFSKNRDFIRQFMSILPITEQSEMMDTDGRLSPSGYRRIQNAVLARAYGNSPTLRRMTESMDDNLRNLSNALVRVAPTIAASKEKMDAGTLHQADIVPDLIQAVEGLSAIKEKGWSVANELSQRDLTGPKYSPESAQLLEFLGANMRSPKRMAEFLQNYYEALAAAGDPNQASMFGDSLPPERMQLLAQANANTQQPQGVPQNAGASVKQDPQRGVNRESTQSAAESRGQPQNEAGNRSSDQGNGVARTDAGGTRLGGEPQGQANAGVIDDAVKFSRTSAPFDGKESGSTPDEALKMSRTENGNRLPDAVIRHRLGELNNHPDYEAAKSGDPLAAARIASDLVDDAMVDAVRAAAGNADLIVPVLSIEASGKNKIPQAVADELAYRLGSSANYDIVQANSPKRTSMDGLSRLLNPPVFEGPVKRGAFYVLVDDTITQGGTFAALASHIIDNGGKVAGVVALTGKQYSAKLAPSSELLQKVRELYQSVEPAFKAITGYGFDALTESEARYLAKHNDAQSVRDRILEEGIQRVGSSDSGGVEEVARRKSQESTQPVIPRTPAANIRKALEKAYGKLFSRLESKGLVTLAQSEQEAIEAAAKARAEKLGTDYQQELDGLMAAVSASRVWHGTPHRGIKQFSTDKIGTGEGAQAYGWGLYFADRQDVADWYRRKLSAGSRADPVKMDGKRVSNAEANNALAFIKSSKTPAQRMTNEYAEAFFRSQISLANNETNSKDGFSRHIGEMRALDVALTQKSAKTSLDRLTDQEWAFLQGWYEQNQSRFGWPKQRGQLYEVEIPEDSDMLHWDKPLSEQSAKVQKALKAAGILTNPSESGRQIYEGRVMSLGKGRLHSPSQKEISLLLLRHGIKGIKFLEGASRGGGKGTANYVIFDGADTRIVDVKYSSSGLIQGFFDSATKRAYMVADALFEDTAGGVLMHEVGIHMAADKTLEPLLNRAAFLVKNAKGEFFDAVRKQMAKAGETSAEEAAAYLVEAYETNRNSAPQSVLQWIKELFAALRGWMYRYGVGVQSVQLTEADISAVARANARGFARRGGAYDTGGAGGSVMSSRAVAGAANAMPQTVEEKAESVINDRVTTFMPLDAAAKAVTKVTGIDWATHKIGDKIGFLLDRYTPEFVKAGVVSDYGVPQAVIDQRTLLQGRQRVQLRKAGALIEKLSTLTRAESRVAYEWMNMDGSDPRAYVSMMHGLPEESVKVLQEVQKMIDQLSREAVRLGQLSEDVYERNRFAYLRRSYAKHLQEQSMVDKASRARTIAVLGEQYKGRGLSESVAMDKIKSAAPDWWGRKLVGGKADTALKGEQFVRLERRTHKESGVAVRMLKNGKNKPYYVTREAIANNKTGDLEGMGVPSYKTSLKEVVYWPANEPVPAKYSEWDREGTWEVRDTNGANAIMWRDFTKDEREAMGEVDEARFAIAKTLHAMIHDVEVGRYLEWMAIHQAKKEGESIPGEVVDASEAARNVFTKETWVRVPDSKIAGTNVLKYGKLAGRYVPGPVWNDLRQVVNGQFQPLGKVYAKLLTYWKTSKTALSPGVHMNNVMSNFVMADWHDVSAAHVSKALRVLLAAHDRDGEGAIGRAGNLAARVGGGMVDKEVAKAIITRYADSGGDIGSWATQEIARDQLDPLLESLQEELQLNGDSSTEVKAGVFSALQHVLHLKMPKATQALAPLVGKAATATVDTVATEAKNLLDLYQAEDDVFRLAAWLKAKEDGKNDMDAGRAARNSFLDYSINAPWIQAMRATGWPFISFTYRAVPMLLDVVRTKPHKIMKLMMVAGALNMLGAMLAGADDDKERKMLPEEKAGGVWGMVPKLIRMPWNDEHDSPVYLDVRRWIPVGDVFDVGQGHSAVPMFPSLMPGGPLALLFEVVLNKSAFTGKPITLETDTPMQKAEKLSDYLYKAFAPNILGLPNTYATTGVVDAMSGRTDAFGREMSPTQAVFSAFGVKLGSYPEDVLRRNLQSKALAEMSEIDKNIAQLKRQRMTHRISEDEFQEAAKAELEKKLKIMSELTKKIG